jgi:hypothetical protein
LQKCGQGVGGDRKSLSERVRVTPPFSRASAHIEKPPLRDSPDFAAFCDGHAVVENSTLSSGLAAATRGEQAARMTEPIDWSWMR